MTSNRFREVLGHLAGGVTVVTSVDPGGAPRGLTATAVCSVSLSPPLVLACVEQSSHTHAAIRASGRYALNFLAESSRSLADRFAGASGDKYEGIRWSAGATGCPLLDEALAGCECVVVEEVAAGDHTIFVGRVEATRTAGAGSATPLLHYRSRYTTTLPLPDDGR